MKNSCGTLSKAAVAMVLIGALAASGGEIVQQARDILARVQPSVVTVSALSKLDTSGSGLPIRIGGLGEAQESSCPGLVLDGAGLTVVSYTALNPMAKMADSIQIRMGDDAGDDSSTVKTKAELSRIRIRLGDGAEVPARLVLKDKELDLAFLVPDPKEGEKKLAFAPVKLSADALAKELDEIVSVSRHGTELGGQPVVDIGRVTSVIAQPRPMYDLSIASSPPGTAIFLPGGELLGLVVAISGKGQGMMSLGSMQMLILPATDVMKLADKAREAAAKKADAE
jgi:S1-C subfamily serine protease